MPKARKMVSLNIEEASGVDHPAHLHEGWLVIKSDNLTSMDDLLSDLNKTENQSDESLNQRGTEEEPMPQDETTKAMNMPDEDKKKNVHEDKEKAVHDEDDAKKMSYKDMEKKIKDLEEELDKAMKKLAKMADKDEDMKKEDVTSLIKEAPEAIRVMLETMEKSAQESKTRVAEIEAVLKSERVARANGDAVEKAKAWKFLGLDAEKVGPALRELAEINEELAKSVEEALSSVNAQAESANIFAEIGKSANPATGNAYDQLTSLAKSVTENKSGVTFEQAFADAVNTNPDLYSQYLNERGA